MTKTKILIVDDHQIVIKGIKSALENHQEFEIVGEAIDGRHAVELTKSLAPDIVIMDISMPNVNPNVAKVEDAAYPRPPRAMP